MWREKGGGSNLIPTCVDDHCRISDDIHHARPRPTVSPANVMDSDQSVLWVWRSTPGLGHRIRTKLTYRCEAEQAF